MPRRSRLRPRVLLVALTLALGGPRLMWSVGETVKSVPSLLILPIVWPMASISATVKACPVMASLLGLALGSYFLQWLMRIVKPRVAAVKGKSPSGP